MKKRLNYVERKIEHMQRCGIAAVVGRYGGACPSWLVEFRGEEQKRQRRRRSLLQDTHNENISSDSVVPA